jgi:hypothetical protein
MVCHPQITLRFAIEAIDKPMQDTLVNNEP